MKYIALSLAIVLAPMAQAEGAISDIDVNILRSAGTGKSLVETEKRLRKLASRWEGDGVPGFTPEDAVILEQVRLAAERAQRMARYLHDDLNGDLVVSTEELTLRARREANRPLRSNGVTVPPSAEQIKYLTERALEKALEPDVNGDGQLTLDELRDHVNVELGNRRHNSRSMGPDMRHDADGDGRVTMEEFIAGMMSVAREVDTNGDGTVSREEMQAIYGPIQRQQRKLRQNDRVRDYLKKALGEEGAKEFTQARALCQFPPVKGEVALHVVGGYEGSALTNIWLGKKTGTAELVDMVIPAEGPRIHLVAPFFGDTILRLRDPGGRVSRVVATQGEIGVIGGAADLEIARVHEACHLDLHDPASGQNPEPGAFYAQRMGLERAAGVVQGYTLGSVNLGTGANSFDRVMMGSVPAPSAATAKASWDRFLLFNPGGFVALDPKTVKAAVPVGKHDIWPQYAGVAALVAEGALVPLPRDDTKRQVLENDAGEIRLSGKTFVPGAGDDAIHMGGLIFTEERPKTWVGRKPQVYLMTRALTLPSGLDGAHGIHIAIPEGLGKPGNMTRSVTTFDLDSETFNELMKR